MADQWNRGGKKQGTGQQGDTQKQQGVNTTTPRPPEGQPGGPTQKGKSGRSNG
jgi:hypothetical protein